MIVVRDGEKTSLINKKTAVALGLFDALHIGHMRIIGAAADWARQNGCLTAVQLIVMPNKAGLENVNTLEKRISILEEFGIDVVFIEDFTEDFRMVTYKSFVSDFLRDKYNAAAVFAGFNYTFGYGAEGNAAMLGEECRKYGIETYIEPRVALENTVSSSKIRELIKNGDMESVYRYMGRRYSVSGTVKEGKRFGREMGFPTANIEFPRDMVVPMRGVYKTRVCISEKWYEAITNVGAKPTVGDYTQNIETHIIGFDGDLYGETIEILFCRYMRDIKSFESAEELRGQLEHDRLEAIKNEE